MVPLILVVRGALESERPPQAGLLTGQSALLAPGLSPNVSIQAFFFHTTSAISTSCNNRRRRGVKLLYTVLNEMILMEIKDFMFFNEVFPFNLLPVPLWATECKYVTEFLHFLMTACYRGAV